MATRITYHPDGDGGLTVRLTPLPGSPGIPAEVPFTHAEVIETAALMLTNAGIAEFTLKDGRYWWGP